MPGAASNRDVQAPTEGSGLGTTAGTQHETRSAYERVAEEQLMSRLTRAKALLARGLRRNLQQIRTILAEAADQADGIGTASERSESDRAVASTVAHPCRLSRTELSATGGKPVSEFLL